MNVPIEKATQIFTEILSTTGADKKEIDVIVKMMLAQDLYQNKFSAFRLSEITGMVKQITESVGKTENIMIDKPAMKLIDGKGKSAWLIGIHMVHMVCTMAKKEGVGVVGMYNSTYHNIMAYYSRMIASQDLVGIVFANGGPASVAPYGGRTPIFGTNPLSYGIPTTDIPIVFDGATAQFAFGTIRLAKKDGKTLAPNSYLDTTGDITTSPDAAVGLVPFGGYKGYAINLMIDILTGIMVRAKSGFDVKSEKDLGSLFIAIDPSLFQPIDAFKKDVSKLVKNIQDIKPMKGFTSVNIPGFRSEAKRNTILARGFFEVPDPMWKEFEDYYMSVVKP